MKQKKNFILTATFAMAMATLLAGCGGGGNSNTPSTGGNPSQPDTPSVTNPSTGPSVEEKHVTGIEITTMPTKTKYKVGEKFNPTGMVVTATYDDESTAIVTDYSYDNHKELTVDDKVITISYQGFEAKVNIVVEEVFDVVIEELKDYRVEGEDFDTGHAVLRPDFVEHGRGFVENGEGASGGANLCGYNPGSKFYINLDVKEDASIFIRASMSDTDLSYDLDAQGLQVKMDDTVLTKQNDDEFYYNGTGDYWNWIDVEYGKVDLTKGKHTLTITSLQHRPNIDYFDFAVLKYGEQSIDKVVTGISIETMPTKTQYEEGEMFDPTGMVVKATYTTYDVETITDYEIDKKDTPLTLADDKVIISYQGQQAEVAINVGKAYLLKLNKLGDHVFEAENLKVDDKWIMRQDMINAGHTTYVVDSSDSSGGKSIERYDNGTVLTLEFYVAEDSKIHFTSRISNYDYFDLNATVEFKMDDTIMTSNNPTFGHRHASDWWNWVEADFGTMDLAKGEHVLTVTMKSAHPNFDCFNFHVMKHGELQEEHNLESLEILNMPTKVAYSAGDTFDPTGLKLKANYSDSTHEVIEEGYTCDTTTPLTKEDTKVVVSYEGMTVEVAIVIMDSIEGNQVIKLEGEDFDKSNLSHNGNGYVESTDLASGGKCLGNGTVGTCEWDYYLASDMTLDIKAAICKYEDYFAKDQFKMYVDGVEINLQNPDLKLGRTDGNDWFNFKEADYVTTDLAAGAHHIKMQIVGCNVDYLQFTFTAK